MQAILDTLRAIRQDAPLSLDLSNSNRYRLLVKESDGSITAYYFAIPIYRRSDRKLLDLQFEHKDGADCFVGYNTRLTVTDDGVTLQNREGRCRLALPNRKRQQSDDTRIALDGAELYPTANGIACRVTRPENNRFSFSIQTEKSFSRIKNNKKYFALMCEHFTPFLTVSCIGAENEKREIIAPAEIRFSQRSDKEFLVSVTTKAPQAASLLFEINLHAEKLFQDTTVESHSPNRNNAYGGTAFLGNSSACGEQWLYTRIMFAPLRDLAYNDVEQIVWYAPTFHPSNLSLSAFACATRFCSFGSNWNNKKALLDQEVRSHPIDGYQTIDLTPLLTKNGRLINRTEGLVIKATNPNSGFCALSTGDSYYAPQLLAVRYRPKERRTDDESASKGDYTVL